MVYFLRDKNNRTIIECEVYNNDLYTSTDIQVYSSILTSWWDSNKVKAMKFIMDIAALDQIRGWWWWEKENEFGNWKSIDEFVKSKFIEIATRYNFYYTED